MYDDTELKKAQRDCEILAKLIAEDGPITPVNTGLTKDMLPHEALAHLGLTDGLEIDDVVFDRIQNAYVSHIRILSVKERLDALKAAAPFYAAQVKSTEQQPEEKSKLELNEHQQEQLRKILSGKSSLKQQLKT